MSHLATKPLQVDQALHGYRGGHNLIASSVQLDSSSAAVMLELSDLLSPRLIGERASYVTGYPLRTAGKFVLARTWIATEMPRPGSVWTHSLILDYAVLATLSDLACLLALFARPTDLSGYDQPLFLNVPSNSCTPGISEYSKERAYRLLKELYVDCKDEIVLSNGFDATEDERLLLSVWGQMWPKLRRNVFFCTSLSRPPLIDSDVRFYCTPTENDEDSKRSENDQKEVVALVNDLSLGAGTQLRRYVSRYTSDVESQRQAVVPLLRIYESLHAIRDERGLIDLGNMIREAFPNAREGRLLKLDFLLGVLVQEPRALDRGRGRAFRVALSVFQGMPSFIEGDSLKKALKEMMDVGGQSPQDIVSAAEPSVSGDTLGAEVVLALGDVSGLDELVRLRCGPQTKGLLARAKLALYGEHEFWPSDKDERTVLLRIAIDAGVSSELILDGIGRDIDTVAFDALVSSRGAEAVLALLQQIDVAPVAQERAIIRVVMERHSAELSSVLQTYSPSLRIISLISEVSDELATLPDWILWKSVVDGLGDQGIQGNLHLACVLFKCGLLAPKESMGGFFRISFDVLHDAAELDRLPYWARKSLHPVLPSVGFFQDWDFCRKLRIAVLRAYSARGHLDKSVLEITAKTQTVIYLLSDFKEVDGGGRGLKNVTREVLEEGAKRTPRYAGVKAFFEQGSKERKKWWM